MDCFDSYYYRLNRKLLSLFGQWPYQNSADKLIRRIPLTSFLLISAFMEGLMLVTKERNFDVYIEVACCQMIIYVGVIRYYLFAVNTEGAIELMESMKVNWQLLADKYEIEIFNRAAEKGRRHTLIYINIIGLAIIIYTTYITVVPYIRHTNSMNVSYSRPLFCRVPSLFNAEKYYYVFIIQMFTVCFLLFLGTGASDTFFAVLMYHGIGMFKVACYRLEHAFDNCNDKDSENSNGKMYQRIIDGVEWHRRAIRFTNAIVTATQWTNLVSLMIGLADIALSLYWRLISKEAIATPLALGLMAHIFYLTFPAQEVADNSVDVVMKAYSGLWYKAPVKQQVLLLLTMQRSLTPSYIQIGKILPATLENYAKEMKTAFSYFVVLRSRE